MCTPPVVPISCSTPVNHCYDTANDGDKRIDVENLFKIDHSNNGTGKDKFYILSIVFFKENM